MKATSCGLVFTLVLALMGCGSQSVRLQVERAPEIVIPNAKSIKIQRFEGSSSNYRTEIYNLSRIHASDLQTALFENKTYEVKMQGAADATLGGTLIFSSDENTSRNESTSKEGKTTSTYTAVRNGRLQVKVVVTDPGGNILDTASFTLTDKSSKTADTSWEARDGLTTTYNMMSSLLKESVPRIVRTIAPYKEYVNRTLASVKKNDQFKEANVAAESGDWKKALDVWKSFESAAPEVAAASLFNQSVYYETQGDLSKAKALAEKAALLSSDKKYSGRVGLINRLIAEQAKLKNNY